MVIDTGEGSAREQSVGGAAKQGGASRFSARGLSQDGSKPRWWADVLSGRVRKDWAAMQEGEVVEGWARR